MPEPAKCQDCFVLCMQKPALMPLFTFADIIGGLVTKDFESVFCSLELPSRCRGE